MRLIDRKKKEAEVRTNRSACIKMSETIKVKVDSESERPSEMCCCTVASSQHSLATTGQWPSKRCYCPMKIMTVQWCSL